MSASDSTTRSPPVPSICESARLPRSSRLSADGRSCGLVIALLLLACIAGDFCVKDEKTGHELFDMRPDAIAVRLEHEAALAGRLRSARAKRRVAQHFADRHAGHLQALEKGQPR